MHNFQSTDVRKYHERVFRDCGKSRTVKEAEVPCDNLMYSLYLMLNWHFYSSSTNHLFEIVYMQKAEAACYDTPYK